VGESEDEREAGETQRKLRHQVQEALEKVPEAQLGDVVIAYEPIWAIGTGKVATPDTAQDAIGFIRALVGDRSQEAAGRVRVFDELWSSFRHTQLNASGRAVGLPDGQMGNSEVGHLNLGAGTVVRQDLTRIDDAVEDGSLARNEVLLRACEEGRRAGRLHLLG